MKHNTNRVRIICICLIVALTISIAGLLAYKNGAFNSVPVVEAKPLGGFDKTLRVITDDDYRPYSFYDENWEYSGHDVELIILIANELQMNLDLQFMPWDKGIEAMANGEADVLMTCDYSDTFSGVDTLMKTEPVSTDEFIVYSKQSIESRDFLYGLRCGVMKNGNVMAQIHMLNLDKESIEYPNNRDAMIALEKGEVDCAIMRYTVGESLLNELGYSDIESTVSIGQSYMCFGVAGENQELTDKINGAMETLKLNGDVERLQEKWLTTFVHTPSLSELVAQNAWVIIIAILIIIVVLLFFIDNERRRQRVERENNRYIEMVENLSNDFECVNFVEIHENDEDDEATLVRISDKLSRIIPEWGQEKVFRRRLEILCREVVVPEDREHFTAMTSREAVLPHLKENGAYYVNFKAKIEEEPAYYQLKFSSIHTSEGKLSAIVCGLHNIDETTRKEIAIQDALQTALDNERETEEKLAKDKILLDYFIDAYTSAYSVDLNNDTFEVLRLDPSLYETFGEHGGWAEMYRWVEEHIHPEDQELMRQMMDKNYVSRRLKNEGNFSFTIRELFGDQERTMRCVIIQGIDEKHVAVGFMDITEEVKKEKETQHMLEEANRSKTDFLFNMSHDIRTPMNAITGFTDLATKYINDQERVRDYLEKIKNSSNHLLELINEVLDMSRVEAGKLTSELAPVSIQNEAEKMVAICQETADKRQIQLALEMDEIKHDQVKADVLHVNRIITNILSNAIKYTMPGGKVVYAIKELKSENPGYGRFRFSVEDNGIGMSSEFVKHIFDSFAREETEVVHSTQGTGLGMAIVKRLVDFLDGTIDIQSLQGKGTKVTVVLPLMLADQSAETKKSGTENANFEGKKVLLVEDNDLNREIATEILNEHGLIVEEAVNGREAVETVKRKGVAYYDIILMDIQMPFMNGYEATRAIRALPGAEKLHIVALSANAFEEDRRKSMEAGMNDHIAKPIKVDELFRVLTKVVEAPEVIRLDPRR